MVEVKESLLNKPVVRVGQDGLYADNPDYARIKAKELYIVHGWSSKDISDSLGIPDRTVDSWIHTSCNGSIAWRLEKEKIYQITIDKLKSKKEDILLQIMGSSVDLMNKGLTYLLDTKQEFTVAEVRKLLDFVTDMNKTVNLEQGKPTEITRTFQGTQDELDRLLNELSVVDEFGTYKKVEH